MNWTDEEIDKLFQESASQMNAPAFQDSFWNEMEALLPQQEKKKGFGWIFGGTLACFALIAAMIFPANHFSGKGKQVAAAPGVAGVSPNKPLTAFTSNQTAAAHTAPAILPAADGSEKTEKSGLTASGERRIKSDDNVSVPGIQPDETITGTDLPVPTVTTEDQTETTIYSLPLLALQSETQSLAPSRFGKYTSRTPKNTFYVQAGFGMMQSYIAGTDKNWMPTFHAGGGYQYKPQGLGFSAGVNISGSFSNNLEITRRSKIYNFSSTNYQQSLMYKQLYTVELPLSVDFRKNRHTVSVGITPTCLVTSVMRFNQFKDDKLSENGTYVGQRAGLNTFGLKPSIAYQLEVAKSWNVGIQLHAQLMQQVDETQFVGNLTKLPLSGQITIRKTLTR